MNWYFMYKFPVMKCVNLFLFSPRQNNKQKQNKTEKPFVLFGARQWLAADTLYTVLPDTRTRLWNNSIIAPEQFTQLLLISYSLVPFAKRTLFSHLVLLRLTNLTNVLLDSLVSRLQLLHLVHFLLLSRQQRFLNSIISRLPRRYK